MRLKGNKSENGLNLKKQIYGYPIAEKKRPENQACSIHFVWYGNIGINGCVDNSEFIKAGQAGDLYGIQVVYPFARNNIRKLVQARSELMKSMANTQGISLYQASNDLSDVQAEFTKKFSFEDQEVFLNLITDEMIAHTNAINDETIKINQQALEQEISNQNLTSTMAGIIVFCCLIFLFFVVFK